MGDDFRLRFYILSANGNPTEVEPAVWGQWFNNPLNRIINKTDIGEFEVSTVFVGNGGRLFETAVFDAVRTIIYRSESNTLEEAEACHTEAESLVLSGKIKSEEPAPW